MPDRSFILYEELESLLIIAPMTSLPDNDWPMIADPTITTSSKAKPYQPTDNTSSSSSSSSSSSPMLENNTSTSYSNNNTTTDQQQMQNTPDRNSPSDNQSIQTSYSNNDNNNIQTSYSNIDNNNNNNNTPIYNTTIIIKSRNNNINTNEKEIQSKGDLFVMVKILLLFLLIKQE